MLKKVPKVAVLRFTGSDLGRDSVYNNEMSSGLIHLKCGISESKNNFPCELFLLSETALLFDREKLTPLHQTNTSM